MKLFMTKLDFAVETPTTQQSLVDAELVSELLTKSTFHICLKLRYELAELRCLSLLAQKASPVQDRESPWQKPLPRHFARFVRPHSGPWC